MLILNEEFNYFMHTLIEFPTSQNICNSFFFLILLIQNYADKSDKLKENGQ